MRTRFLRAESEGMDSYSYTVTSQTLMAESAPADSVVGPIPRARRTDPVTSHQAAERASQFAGTHASRILAALDDLMTATAAEIAEHAGLSVVQVDRRMVECQRAGKVRLLTMNGKPLIRMGYRVWARV